MVQLVACKRLVWTQNNAIIKWKQTIQITGHNERFWSTDTFSPLYQFISFSGSIVWGNHGDLDFPQIDYKWRKKAKAKWKPLTTSYNGTFSVNFVHLFQTHNKYWFRKITQSNPCDRYKYIWHKIWKKQSQTKFAYEHYQWTESNTFRVTCEKGKLIVHALHKNNWNKMTILDWNVSATDPYFLCSCWPFSLSINYSFRQFHCCSSHC